MPVSLTQLVLASTNRGKIAEIEKVLTPLHIIVRPLAEFSNVSVKETALSFIENAFIKARYGAEVSRQTCLAEDSGLIVPVLGNVPGVYSARYAGKKATDCENRKKLLTALAGKEGKERKAFFCCAMVLMDSPRQADPLVAVAYWHGSIAHAEKGHNGFGYDAIFVPAGSKQTAAELELERKNKISHRGQALRQVVDFIRRRPSF